MAYNIGAKIGIDGEAEFRRQIKRIDAEYKALTAQIEAQTVALGKNATVEDKAEANSEALRKQKELLAQREKLLAEAVEKSVQANGKDAEATSRLTAAMYDTQRQAEELGHKFENTGDNMEAAGEKALDFGDVLKANVISDAIMAGLQKLASYAKDFAGGMIEAAASVQATEAQFTQTFGSAADEAKTALETIAGQTGITATRMEASYTKIFAFAKTSGADTEEAMQIASRAMEAAADSAAYYDRSIEDTTETVQAFLKGNYANDAALGIAATETTRNTAANKLYAKSFQELSESQKVDVLLSMVEAGNKASGAIGQAARESDAWENVNGELSESIRQLQAEAGKPFLKNLTPIIQKLTQKIKDLTKNADWDAFGSAVADTFEVIVDHGPEVLKLLASIGAGVAAFKAVEKAQQLVSMASGFLKLGEAATTAGTMVQTAGAAAAVSPWGAVAVAIGAVVGVVTAAAIEIESTNQKINASADKLRQTMEDANDTYRESETETAGAAIAAERYVGKLRQLEAAGLDTAEAQTEYQNTVKAINELIPDLNLQIDEETGKLTESTAAVLDNIKAWRQKAVADALQKRVTDQIEAQANAMAELAQKEKDRQKLLQEQERLIKKINSESFDFKSYDQTVRDLREVSKELGINEESQKALSAAVKEYEGEIDSAEQAAREYIATVEKSGETQKTTSGIILESGKTLSQAKEELAALREEYENARVAAYDSSISQVGYFDEIATESDWSTEKVLNNLLAQAEAFTSYSDNLKKAMDMGLDEALVQQLSDGSTESMQILAALVSGTQENIDEINAAFREADQARHTMADTMVGIQTDMDQKMSEIVTDMRTGAKHIVQGAAEGISENTYLFTGAVSDMAYAGSNTFRAVNLIASPSKLYKKEAGYIPQGAAEGVELETDKFTDAIRKMSELGEKQLDAAAMERATWAQPVTSMQSSTTTNLGGVSIYVTARDGDTAEQLADIVMDKIQTEVWKRER